MALYRSPVFRVSWSFGSRDKVQYRFFKMVAILDFQLELILATFDLQVTSILSMKFRVSWPFGSG